MSLKPQRNEAYGFTDVTFFCNSVLTRGGVAGLVTAGSGAAYDQSLAAVGYVANSSGVRPIGIMLNDVVNYDLTRQHINWHQNQTQLGGKVTLVKKGFVVTNNIVGTPGIGDAAILDSSGNIRGLSIANDVFVNKVLNPRVGIFHGTLDEDGYAKVYVDL